MTSLPPPTRSGRRASGEFPQPTSPWESRGLLYAEVIGALAVLALVLFIDVRGLPSEANAAAPALPAATTTVTATAATDSAN